MSFAMLTNMKYNRPVREPKLRADAYRHREKGEYRKAIASFRGHLKTHPKDVVAFLDLGHCFMQIEDFVEAAKVFAKIIEIDPKHVNALSNLGGALYRSGKPSDAKAILEYALELDPKCLYAHINLGGVLQALGDSKGNLNSALSAVSIDPASALAFNNLGSALSDLAMYIEAKHAYETAHLLQPNQVDTLINLAAVEAKLGSSERAIEMYEKTLRTLPSREKHRAEAIRFFASFEYLKLGALGTGWDYYDGGFSPMVPLAGARTPKRVFDVPRWQGEPLEGKRLMVWREQGLGDELLFGSCLPDLRTLGAEQIIIECEPRLVSILQRSFPDFIVRGQVYYANNLQSVNIDFDYELPMGSLMKHFRRSALDFAKSGPYLKADSFLMHEFETKLEQYKNLPLVGICWRSGKLSPVRNLSYTVLEDWLPILSSKRVNVVSLQYGDAEDEIIEVESKFGVRVIRWDDLDQKNELDRVFALMKCLDLVISVNTAPLRMASALGLPVLSVEGNGWTRFGRNEPRSPWFSNHHILEPDTSNRFESRMTTLLDIINQDLPSPTISIASG